MTVGTKLSISNIGVQTQMDEIDIKTYLDAYKYSYTRRASRDDQKTITYYIHKDLSKDTNAIELFKRKFTFVSITFPLQEEFSLREEERLRREKRREEKKKEREQYSEARKERLKVKELTTRFSITLPIRLAEKIKTRPETLSKTIEAALEAYLK